MLDPMSIVILGRLYDGQCSVQLFVGTQLTGGGGWVLLGISAWRTVMVLKQSLWVQQEPVR